MSPDRNFADAIRILNGLRAPYWLCHGTLLGLIRDGDLIPWDRDVDLAVFAGTVDRKTLRSSFEEEGFIWHPSHPYRVLSSPDKDKFLRHGGRKVDVHYYRKTRLLPPDSREVAQMTWLLPRKDLRIARVIDGSFGLAIRGLSALAQNLPGLDRLVKRLMRSLDAKLVSLLERSSLGERKGYQVPIELLQEFQVREFLGVRCRVPAESVSICEQIYGPNWTTPFESPTWTHFLK